MNTLREKEEKEQLAKAQGETYQAALEKMKDDDVNASVTAGDYVISVACEDAEGMYMYAESGELLWMVPEANENQHFEVVVQDKFDLRFLPGLTVSAKLFDTENTLVATLSVPFIWHPFLFHYGINCVIPREGDYTAEVTIKKPSFHRHDEVVGKRYEHDVTVMLGPLHLEPGRKDHGPE